VGEGAEDAAEAVAAVFFDCVEGEFFGGFENFQ